MKFTTTYKFEDYILNTSRDTLPDAFSDVAVLDMMKKLRFEVDETIDSKFPAHRICRAEIYTKDARVVIPRL